MIVVLLAVIAWRQSGPDHVQASTNVEYYFAQVPTADHNTALLSDIISAMANRVDGKLHSFAFGEMGRNINVLFEVPKGTLAKLKVSTNKK